MKTKLFVVVALAVVVGFAGCRKKETKSNACDITGVTINGVAYDLSGTAWTHIYPKTAADTWTGWPGMPAAAQITISEKATISPNPSTAQDYEASAVTFTVTAEDGVTTKTYTVKCSRNQTIGG